MTQRKITIAATLAAGAAALAIGAGAAVAGPPGIAPPGPSLQQRTCWSSDYNVDPTCVAPWQNGYLGIQGPYLNP